MGRMNNLVAAMKNPRRLFVTILGVILALVWLSNVILGILFREKYEPEAFHIWTTLMFSGYAIWHFVHASWQRPESAIEWTESERNNLMASPLTRDEIVLYRLMSVLGATTLKAAVGTILILPDLTYPLLGFVGLWLGLTFIELIRLTVDAWTVGMSSRTYQLFRGIVLTALIAMGLTLISGALVHMSAAEGTSKLPTVILFFRGLGSAAADIATTPLGMAFTAPFSVFVSLVGTSTLSWHTAVLLAGSAVMTFGLMQAVIRLDSWSEQQQQLREKSLVALEPGMERPSPRAKFEQYALRLIGVSGGPLVWRQMMAASRHFGGVILALIPPALLSMMPLFVDRLKDEAAFGNFIAGLAFYTFLLLPAALKFDFRRDYDHLLLLKLLPKSPMKIMWGQVVTPAIITTAFQYIMLAIGYAIRPVDPLILIACIFAFPSMNVAIYGWENVLFLLFPQRLKQEGVEVFLRTTIIFTAKGLAFAALLVFVFLWALCASLLTEQLNTVMGDVIHRRIVFGVGVWLATSWIGYMMIRLGANRFQALDTFPNTSPV